MDIIMFYKIAFLIAIMIAFIGWMYWGLWILIHKKLPKSWFWSWFWMYRIFGYKRWKWVMERPIILGLSIILSLIIFLIIFILWWFSVDWSVFDR